jgi:hypothetical protein
MFRNHPGDQTQTTVIDSEPRAARLCRPEHEPIDEEACEEQYERRIFRRKILDWRPVILKLPSAMSSCVAGALAF